MGLHIRSRARGRSSVQSQQHSRTPNLTIDSSDDKALAQSAMISPLDHEEGLQRSCYSGFDRTSPHIRTCIKRTTLAPLIFATRTCTTDSRIVALEVQSIIPCMTCAYWADAGCLDVMSLGKRHVPCCILKVESCSSCMKSSWLHSL